MREKIDCFLPCSNVDTIDETLQTLRQSKTIQHINLLVDSNKTSDKELQSADDCTIMHINSLTSTQTILDIERNADAEYTLLSLKTTPVDFGMHALERLLRVAADSGAGLVYADSYVKKADGSVTKHPTIDYQTGSIRDDFDFGQLVLIRSSLLHAYATATSRRL